MTSKENEFDAVKLILEQYNQDGENYDGRFNTVSTERLSQAHIERQRNSDRALHFDARSITSWMDIADESQIDSMPPNILTTVRWNTYVLLHTSYGEHKSLAHAVPLLNPKRDKLTTVLRNLRPGSTLMVDHIPRTPNRIAREGESPPNQRRVPEGTILFGSTLIPDITDKRIADLRFRPSDGLGILLDVAPLENQLRIQSSQRSPEITVPVIWRIYIENGLIAGGSILQRHNPINSYEARFRYGYQAAEMAAETMVATMKELQLIPYNPATSDRGNVKPDQIKCTLDFAITGAGIAHLRDGSPGRTGAAYGQTANCNFGYNNPNGIALCLNR